MLERSPRTSAGGKSQQGESRVSKQKELKVEHSESERSEGLIDV